MNLIRCSIDIGTMRHC